MICTSQPGVYICSVPSYMRPYKRHARQEGALCTTICCEPSIIPVSKVPATEAYRIPVRKPAIWRPPAALESTLLKAMLVNHVSTSLDLESVTRSSFARIWREWYFDIHQDEGYWMV